MMQPAIARRTLLIKCSGAGEAPVIGDRSPRARRRILLALFKFYVHTRRYVLIQKDILWFTVLRQRPLS